MAKKTVFTAANGSTRTSTTKHYTHAVIVFDPKEPWKVPGMLSCHGSWERASKASSAKHLSAYRTLIVPLTTDGSRDEAWAKQIADLRTQEDIDNIPAMRIAAAEKEVAAKKEYVRSCKERLAEGPTEFCSTEQAQAFLDKAEAELAEAQQLLVDLKVTYEPKPEVQLVDLDAQKAARPVKIRKPRRTSFVSQVADVIRIATPDGTTETVISSGQRVSVERDADGRYVALIINLGKGKFFEFRCPFSAANAGQISTQVWKLMQSMEM